MSAQRKANHPLADIPNSACLKVCYQSSTEPSSSNSNVWVETQGKDVLSHNVSEAIEPRKVYISNNRLTSFIYRENGNKPVINAAPNTSGRSLSSGHSEETEMIGTREIPLVIPSTFSLLDGEPSQVLTTTRAGRSTAGKSGQFVVQVGSGNALSLGLQVECEATSPKGAVISNVSVNYKRQSFGLRTGLHKVTYLLSTCLLNLTNKVLLVENRMREIRLSGLARGLPVREALFMNAGGGLF